jgi:hypothetical protein
VADRYRAGKRLWSAADDETLRLAYPDTPTPSVAARLRRSIVAVYRRADSLGLKKSAAYLAGPDACRLRRGDQVGARARFRKGHVPANKGLRRPGWFSGRMRETQFKPGQRNGKSAEHFMPVGSTRLVDGYIYRKISDVPNVAYTVNWKPEAHLVWRRAGRRLRAGQALVFRNGNVLDIRLDNLERISRRELMARNSVHNLPKPLARTIQLLGALKNAIRRRAKREEQDRRSA